MTNPSSAPPLGDPVPASMTAPPHDDMIRPDPAPTNMTSPPPHDDLIQPQLAPPPIPTAMKGLVSLVDKLQRACTSLADQDALPADWDWDALPSVAVVGVQGAGKSSVLESLVGKDFLPKGSGIVTRRPLIVQLRTTHGTGEHDEFLHHPSKKYINFSEVNSEIAGCSKEISDVPIHLSIFSPNVVNLTLIDLPGLIKVAVDGQLDSTAQQIENMVRAFIEKPNCIILVVSPASQDLATSDAIKISQEVDPEGGRTFGVLTQIDLMDEGTNAVKILEGRSYALPYRWTGVINPTQQDTDKGLDMTAAMRRDREYFANTPEYEHLAHRMGIEHVAKSLSKHLEFHVKSKFAASKLFSSFDMKIAYKKSLLQGYTLRSFGSFPVYQVLTESLAHDMQFRCIVRVQDQVYSSLLDHRHLKEADEDAAAVAYKVILGEDSMDTLLEMVNQANFAVVSTLKEFAIKKSVCEPCFSSSMVYETCKMTRWLSTVEVDGQVFIGEAARSKQLSVRKAAAAAIVAFLEDGDTLMVSVVQGKRLVNAVPSKLKDESAQKHCRKRRKLRHE